MLNQYLFPMRSLRGALGVALLSAAACLTLAAVMALLCSCSAYRQSEGHAVCAGSIRQEMVMADSAMAQAIVYERDSTAMRHEGDSVRVVEHWHTMTARQKSRFHRTSQARTLERDTITASQLTHKSPAAATASPTSTIASAAASLAAATAASGSRLRNFVIDCAIVAAILLMIKVGRKKG